MSPREEQLLARLDERQVALDEKLDALIAHLSEKFDDLDKKIDDKMEEQQRRREDLVYLFEGVKDSFVTKDEFEPIKNGFYTIVGIICVGFVGALLTIVFGGMDWAKHLVH
jgi:hypothetical protein